MEPAQEFRKSVFREYAEAIIIALLLAFFIRTFVVQAFKIPSGSMIPTLLVGDHILVSKFAYGVRNPFSGAAWLELAEPQRQDVIVFKYPQNPSQDYIKRVIGRPGDTVEIRDKVVLVNGERIEDPHAVFLDDRLYGADQQPRDNFGPVLVAADQLFVMGDNRDNSHDGRFWGMVDFRAVKGKAFMIYWSWDGEETAVRWSRLGDIIR